MSEIKTALERFQAYCASKGILSKSYLAHIHKIDQFEEHERKELRAAYEALQKENAAQANRIVALEDRLSSFPIPTTVAMQKISKLRSEGFKEYAATVLNRENQYCIVGDYGDVRWSSKNGD